MQRATHKKSNFENELNLCNFVQNLVTMNAYAEKIEIIQWIAGLKDQSILEQLKKIKDNFATQQLDWFDTISLEERESIQRGLDDSKNGLVTPHSEVRKRYEKWL